MDLTKEQKDIIKSIETEASYEQTDYYREKGFGNYEEYPETEDKPRSILFSGYFLPEDVSEEGARIYRKHLVIGMKKAGFDNDLIIGLIKIRTNRISYVEECKRLLPLSN